MLFPTHVLAGYLLGRRWTGLPAWAALGASLPDLIDKPLGAVGATDLYQSVGHSALALLGVMVVWLLARHTGGADARVLAIGTGWASHVLLDVLGVALNGRPENWVSLLWPVSAKPSPLDLGPVAFYFEYLLTPSFFAEVGIWLAGAYVLLQSPAARQHVRSYRRL